MIYRIYRAATDFRKTHAEEHDDEPLGLATFDPYAESRDSKSCGTKKLSCKQQFFNEMT